VAPHFGRRYVTFEEQHEPIPPTKGDVKSRSVREGNLAMPKEQDASDLHELNRGFTNYSTFHKVLRACGKDASRRVVVKSYIERLCNDLKESGR
jgi:hypothetical protein